MCASDLLITIQIQLKIKYVISKMLVMGISLRKDDQKLASILNVHDFM